MYDLHMENELASLLPVRLQTAIELRSTSPAQVARDSGVSKSTISQILSGDRPNTPATIVAKLARVLLVSVDYLVGITKDPEPKSLGLGSVVVELAGVAKQLSSSRQRDLLLMAKTYAETAEESKRQLLREMRDMLFAAADNMGRGEELDAFRETLLRDGLEDGENMAMLIKTRKRLTEPTNYLSSLLIYSA